MDNENLQINISMTKEELKSARTFVDLYSNYTLEDVIQRPDVRSKFEKWQIRKDLSSLEYYQKGIQRSDPFIRITLEDLVEALDKKPKLKEHVLNYAQNELLENSLNDDKRNTLKAIKYADIDILYRHDSEVRENFCKCFVGGMESMRKELLEKNKELSTKQQRDISR